MTENSEKIVLITGASSGIGHAAAKRLAAAGHRVVLGARRADRLADLATRIREAGGSAEYRELDVTDAGEFRAFVEFARERFGRVDVVVNNAGIMPLSNLDAGLVGEWDRMIDVNIRGVLHGIAAALPLMRAQGYGQFVNIASIGAHEVVPSAAVYCATKYAVRALSEGLRQESGGDVRVSVISPGVTESELADSITDPEAAAGMREYRKIALPATAIAEAIHFAVSQPSEVDVNEVLVRPAATR